jgi:uncharacterized phage-associated protein
MQSALAIANYFVKTAQEQGVRDLPPMKLHGLVYLAHGWLLGAAGATLIKGSVMASRDGVFIAELRDAGCWGNKNVSQPVSTIEMDEKRGVMVEHTPQLIPNNPVVSALAWVWKTYGPMPAFRVVQHVKEPGSPWDLIWNDEERSDEEPKDIPNTTIKLWFRSLSSKREEQGKHSKLSGVERSELKPKLEKTQRMLAQPDPNRLRST